MMASKITSLTNSKIKVLIKLRQKRERVSTGLTIVEGVKEVSCALEAGIQFTEFYICSSLLKNDGLKKEISASKGIVVEVTESVFEKISFGERKEGIVGVCHIPNKDITKSKLGKNSIFVVIENVEKPGNLGAILRSADAAGVAGVIVCNTQSDVYNPNVIRASLGTIFTVDVFQMSVTEVLSFLKDNNIQICAATPTGKTVYFDADFKKATAIVVGSEHDGVSDVFSKQADVKIQIPMNGKADSLNVSVSAAVILYETIRQRRK